MPTCPRVIPLKDNIPTRRFPIVTVLLIVACCVVYFGFQRGGIRGPADAQVVKYAAIPYEITHPGKHCGLVGVVRVSDGRTARIPSTGEPLCEGKHLKLSDAGRPIPGRVIRVPGKQPSTLLTILFAMFMHGGLLHLAGNMLFLW